MNGRQNKQQKEKVTRREAMKGIAAGALVAASVDWASQAVEAQDATRRDADRPKRDFAFFSKPFQSLSYDELGELAAQAGYTGLEFPVRPKGHIEPEAVADELPEAVEAFRKHGIGVTLMTTGINEVSDQQHTERVLRTAAELGIKRFRMGYYQYDLNESIPEQLAAIQPKLDDLIALCGELGVKPLYQNHSGNHGVGAAVWDAYWLVHRHSPEKVGLAFDIGHAMIEGSQCWPIHFALIKDYIDVAYIKDPVWDADRDRFGWAPLGQGRIPASYYKMLADTGFQGPMSVHVEYLNHKDPAMQPQFRKAIQEDLASLRKTLDDV